MSTIVHNCSKRLGISGVCVKLTPRKMYSEKYYISFLTQQFLAHNPLLTLHNRTKFEKKSTFSGCVHSRNGLESRLLIEPISNRLTLNWPWLLLCDRSIPPRKCIVSETILTQMITAISLMKTIFCSFLPQNRPQVITAITSVYAKEC